MYELSDEFVSLGDPFIDKWEREIRAGIVPDLMEDLPPEEAEKLINWSRRAYKKKIARGIVPGETTEGIGSLPEDINDIEELLGDNDSFGEKY